MRPIDFLLRSANCYPDKVAISGADASLTYTELVAQSQGLACALQAMAPETRARIAICGGNHVAHVVALLATLLAGKIWVPLNPRAGKMELDRIIEFTEASVVIAQENLADKLNPGNVPMLVYSSSARGNCALGSLIESNLGRRPVDAYFDLSDIQAIKFTGGTTGAPKGVMQSYRAWNTTIVSFLHAMRLDANDRYLAVAPITHGTSTFLLPVFGAGGTVILSTTTKPRDVLDVMEHERVTAVFMPPTLVYSLLDDKTVAKRDWSALRHFVHAAAPMRPDKIIDAQRVFGEVETGYGQTEAPSIISYLSAAEARDPRNLQSVGRAALLTQIGIMDANGRLLSAGETGEVVVRGDLIMSGYWRQPDKTSEAIRDGWLHTGDGGYLDDRGYLFLKDRIRDVIITGGFNVYPADVEDTLGTHPAVYDCAAVGVEDAKWGEAVHAVVQLRDGAAATDSELIAWVKSRLDSVKTPKAVHFVAALPRTPNGKVSRKDARLLITQRTGGMTS